MSNKKIKSFETMLTPEYNNSVLYINRELSWLEFNKRVLLQTIRKEVPLLERLNFLAITESNLDEFIMVRFAALLNKINKGFITREISGMNPFEEYKAVLRAIHNFKDLQYTCYETLLNKLSKHNIEICKFNELNKNEKREVEKIFYKFIYPLITPINLDTTNEFPILKSKYSNIVVSLEDRHNPNLNVISFIPLDVDVDRLFKIPGKSEKTKYINLEEIIYAFLDRIYVNKKILDYGCFKILREADIPLDHDENRYITDRMRLNLNQRETSEVVFIVASNKITKPLLKIICKIFGVKKKHVHITKGPIEFSGMTKISSNENNMNYEHFVPQFPKILLGDSSIFQALDEDDIVLHHPYSSFEPVINFLEQAAEDPDVLSIKQTLYRVSSIDSPIVNALCKAAENGKQVSVILEIKARFDEERNLSLISKLKQAGCKLVYGVEELKTHCKFIVIVKRTKNGLKMYSHMSTGNYNDKTAKIYTDISYFTSAYKVGQDLISVFNMLSGFSDPTDKINKLYFSPYNLRKELYKNIDKEIKLASNGKKSVITIKVNSLSDKGIIDKLYAASKKGVKVNIFCRGICSMKPINKNITINSLVGRFLEHSRIYVFSNEGKPTVFISSADLLTRNLDKRFELLIPINNTKVKIQILNLISLYYKDTFNSTQMDKKGLFHLIDTEGKKDFNIQEALINKAISDNKLKSIPKMLSFKK